MSVFKAHLKKTICERLIDLYPLSPAEVDITATPNRAMGDVGITLPFYLARKMKSSPRELALEIIRRLTPLEGVDKIDLAGGGYINFHLDRKAYFLARLRELGAPGLRPEEDKIIIEHTNINPNKAAHIGHLRNACLGDTLGRALKYMGEKVEIQNYIDDTGVQVVDVVFGFIVIEGKTLDDVIRLPGKFDYYCWDLYAKVSPYLAAHPEAQERKAEILRRIEHGQDPEAELARHISRRILNSHLATMGRIGVGYDVLPCESSILRLRFWEKAFDLLKEKQAVYHVGEGDNKGCWVMRVEGEEEREKIIVRSDGTVTYVGKDIAYQLWKFGLLEQDFYYEPFLEEKEKTVWISTDRPNAGGVHFGGASRVYNVIDTRQSYLQKIVVQGLRALKYLRQADKSVHFSYEMVALSPKSLKELHYEMSEDEKDRAFLEVSGRKGLGVKADDLLDRLEEKAFAEVNKRNPDLSEPAKKEIARAIAAGALRYFMLKFARNSLIVFDFEEALSFEGETGPYLQYSCVRLNNIFRKLEERRGVSEKDVQALMAGAEARLDLLPGKEAADFWDLVLYASQFEEETLRSVTSLEFSHLAKFAFNLCQKFNGYYHLYSILAEENIDIRNIRLMTIAYVRETLGRALSLMGIPIPERM